MFTSFSSLHYLHVLHGNKNQVTNIVLHQHPLKLFTQLTFAASTSSSVNAGW